jgi:hypothetical protein
VICHTLRRAGRWPAAAAYGHHLFELSVTSPRSWLCSITAVLLALVHPVSTTGAQSATCNGGSSCTLTTDLTLGISYVARLSLVLPANASDPVSIAEMVNGSSEMTGPKLTVKSNAPFRVEVQATQSTWTYIGAATNPNKPSSDLSWSSSIGGTYAPANVSTQFLPLGSGSSTPTAGIEGTIYFRSFWNWTTSPPGNYKLPISFTLVAP